MRRIPKRGIGYGVLRYLSERQQVREQLAALPTPEIIFNYLGQYGQAASSAEAAETSFGAAHESHGTERSLAGHRTHVIEINGSIANGRLYLEWTYSRNLHQRATIEAIADDYLTALRQLINSSQANKEGNFSVSDFTDFGWGEDDLNEIMGAINNSDQ